MLAIEGAETLADSYVLPLLSTGAHDVVSYFVLLSVFKGLLLEYKEANLAYHCSSEVQWENDACVGWFP